MWEPKLRCPRGTKITEALPLLLLLQIALRTKKCLSIRSALQSFNLNSWQLLVLLVKASQLVSWNGVCPSSKECWSNAAKVLPGPFTNLNNSLDAWKCRLPLSQTHAPAALSMEICKQLYLHFDEL